MAYSNIGRLIKKLCHNPHESVAKKNFASSHSVVLLKCLRALEGSVFDSLTTVREGFVSSLLFLF